MDRARGAFIGQCTTPRLGCELVKRPHIIRGLFDVVSLTLIDFWETTYRGCRFTFYGKFRKFRKQRSTKWVKQEHYTLHTTFKSNM